jgi:hypothetical protein
MLGKMPKKIQIHGYYCAFSRFDEAQEPHIMVTIQAQSGVREKREGTKV